MRGGMLNVFMSRMLSERLLHKHRILNFTETLQNAEAEGGECCFAIRNEDIRPNTPQVLYGKKETRSTNLAGVLEFPNYWNSGRVMQPDPTLHINDISPEKWTLSRLITFINMFASSKSESISKQKVLDKLPVVGIDPPEYPMINVYAILALWYPGDVQLVIDNYIYKSDISIVNVTTNEVLDKTIAKSPVSFVLTYSSNKFLHNLKVYGGKHVAEYLKKI